MPIRVLLHFDNNLDYETICLLAWDQESTLIPVDRFSTFGADLRVDNSTSFFYLGIHFLGPLYAL